MLKVKEQTKQQSSGILSFRTPFISRLKQLHGGFIRLNDHSVSSPAVEFGDAKSLLRAELSILDGDVFKKIATGGSLGAAEAFMDGDWDSEDLTSLIRIFIRNLDAAHSIDASSSWFRRLFDRTMQRLKANTIRGSKSNIAQHYDLGNDFYSLWLDETMNYSCAVFDHPEVALREASIAKMERVCQDLKLGPNDHLLEIGTGWGGLAIHAAKRFGCQVTTTTISDEQYKLAFRRVVEAGLEDRVTVLNRDYRELDGRYDKLVSIEMIEAVGHQYLPTFFEKCSQLLAKNGRMLLQSIVIADERYEFHRRSVDFISKYIFPGGALPSIAKLTELAAKHGGFRMLQLTDIAPHYAETLRRWRENFVQQLPSVRKLGFDERFIRMWQYYLCYCEAAFDERQINCVQMLLAKRSCHFDPVTSSNYSGVEERESGSCPTTKLAECI